MNARVLIPEAVEQKGTQTTETQSISKTTTLSQVAAGPFAQFEFFTFGLFTFLVEGGISIGKLSLVQETDGSTHSEMKSSAWSIDSYAELGIVVPAGSLIFATAHLGYSRQKSNAFSVESTSGTAFSSFTAGDRLAIDPGSGKKDLTAELSGPYT